MILTGAEEPAPVLIYFRFERNERIDTVIVIMNVNTNM